MPDVKDPDLGRPAEHVRCGNCVYLDIWKDGPDAGKAGTCRFLPPLPVFQPPASHSMKVSEKEDYEQGATIVTHESTEKKSTPMMRYVYTSMPTAGWCGQFWPRRRGLPPSMETPPLMQREDREPV